MDVMFVFEMDRQAIDGGLLLVHLVFHDVPASLCRTNITCTYIIQYLIYILSHSHGGTVVTFVYILVDVFDGLDGGADFDIDMPVIACGQIGIIRNDIAIVKSLTFGVGTGPTIVRSDIFWITIFTHAGFRAEGLWIVLAALSIDHAGCFWVSRTAGTVDHTLCDCGIEHGMSDRVRDMSRDNGVYMSRITDLELLPQKDEEVDVRETTFLKLYGKDKALNIAKETPLYVFKHSLDLLSKDTCNNVRVIRGSLMFPRLIRIIIVLFIRPAGICCHGEKDVWFATMSGNGHGVLEELVHVMGATWMGCR